MKLIKRMMYINELEDVRLIPDIKVITGIRRSGKSKLMESFSDNILAEDPGANIIHIDFNLTDYEELLEYHALEGYIEAHYQKARNNYVLIDEIQMCSGFEKAVNSLYARGKYDLYVTGSNAFLQSSDLATLFVGRTYEVQLFPFSFAEYLEYYPSQDIYGSFTRYFPDGGMAGSYLYHKEEQKHRYLNDEVLNALIIRDVVKKYRIRNIPLLNAVIDYLMDNIGNVTSIRNITEVLEADGRKADHKTVSKYVDDLCKAFLFYRVRRYDIKGKKYMKSEDKYYLADHGFRFARLGSRNQDYGRVLENMVAIELLRRGYEVYVGKLWKKEIDFVAIHNGTRTYIQVAYDISDEGTFEREIEPLLSIKDAYPKMLITRIYKPEYDWRGIRVIDAADWMRESIPQN